MVIVERGFLVNQIGFKNMDVWNGVYDAYYEAHNGPIMISRKYYQRGNMLDADLKSENRKPQG
jgi:hypothetical protein